MKTVKFIAVFTLVFALTAGGCGGKKAAGPALTWSSAKYRITAQYPGNWKVKDMDTLDDPKTGRALVAFFSVPDPVIGTGDIRQRPPMVTIHWTPRPARAAAPAQPDSTEEVPQVQQGPLGIPVESKGIVSGWTEFGAEDIETRQIKWAGSYDAEEAAATAKPGTAFYSLFTDQLGGRVQKVRLISIALPAGTMEITRVAPADEADLLAEADMIADSIAPSR